MPVAARIDEVAGDERALEAELGVERDLAEAGADVGDDLHVGGGVAADRRVGAVGDAVAGHEHAAGAKNVDAVAVLPGAAAVGADALDAVVGDDAAVLAGLRAPDLDAVVGAVGDRVVQDVEARSHRGCGCRPACAVVTVQSVTLPAQSSSAMPLAALRVTSRPRSASRGCASSSRARRRRAFA